jgi:hypothetical protein
MRRRMFATSYGTAYPTRLWGDPGCPSVVAGKAGIRRVAIDDCEYRPPTCIVPRSQKGAPHRQIEAITAAGSAGINSSSTSIPEGAAFIWHEEPIWRSDVHPVHRITRSLGLVRKLAVIFPFFRCGVCEEDRSAYKNLIDFWYEAPWLERVQQMPTRNIRFEPPSRWYCRLYSEVFAKVSVMRSQCSLGTRPIHGSPFRRVADL